MARNRTTFAILGFLAEHPMSGYDIKKIVEHNIRDFWYESYGTIYPTLKKFITEGLAEKTVERQEGKPDRVVYSITPAGKEELLGWLKAPLEDRRTRDELLAKFVFGYLVSKEANIEQIENYRQKLEERLQWYLEMEVLLKKTPIKSRKKLLEYLSLRQGGHMLEARLNWCDEVLTALRKFKGD
jgi:PadR family transcriptional regulator AphA